MTKVRKNKEYSFLIRELSINRMNYREISFGEFQAYNLNQV